MNKRYKKRLLAAWIVCCGLCSLMSCTLDESPRDQIPEEAAYQTATSLFQNTVATLYTYIGGSEDGQGLQGTCRGVYDLQTFGSDEAMLPTRGGDWYDGGLWQDMYRHSWSAGHDLPKNAWLYLYKVITLCNRSLEQIEKHQILLSDIDYKGYMAEVRALRAIYYWYLLDLFGNVPIVTSSVRICIGVTVSNQATTTVVSPILWLPLCLRSSCSTPRCIAVSRTGRKPLSTVTR